MCLLLKLCHVHFHSPFLPPVLKCGLPLSPSPQPTQSNNVARWAGHISPESFWRERGTPGGQHPHLHQYSLRAASVPPLQSWCSHRGSLLLIDSHALLGPFPLKPFYYDLHKNGDSKSIVHPCSPACGPVPRTRQYLINVAKGTSVWTYQSLCTWPVIVASNLTTTW